MENNRFPKSSRLRKREDFLLVKNRGRCIRTRSFIIYRLKTSSSTGPRLGVTASKKVGGAVQRNRTKRLVRDYFRRHSLLLDNQCDYSIIVKKNACSLKMNQVEKELEVILSASRRNQLEPCNHSC